MKYCYRYSAKWNGCNNSTKFFFSTKMHWKRNSWGSSLNSLTIDDDIDMYYLVTMYPVLYFKWQPLEIIEIGNMNLSVYYLSFYLYCVHWVGTSFYVFPNSTTIHLFLFCIWKLYIYWNTWYMVPMNKLLSVFKLLYKHVNYGDSGLR
jgi:hypothetical protein